jgi:hypothetical protein
MTAIPTMMRAVAIDRFGGPDVYRGCRRLGRRHPGRVGQRGFRRVPRLFWTTSPRGRRSIWPSGT